MDAGAGRQTMMTMYAPIAFGPLPLLAFQHAQDGQLQLVASGVPVVSCCLCMHISKGRP